ncbi:hypothetical protein [Maliponia aquimaris]|uniref:Uncharacterized protein n=1 Tax=Maliponia aquimaris TaxID=1673631 RepID=A0A238KMF4_9RHOB|nr:hypothetical protein [Maliponia aquimaris]SMX43236.1 hypothetical protein MAA8898_02775 [Maliponia aquimaris]
MADRWSFRPAALRARAEWRLDGDVLTGPQGRGDLGQVERAVFVETILRGTRMRRLDLVGPEGLTRIALNCSALLPPDDPDRAAHRALCLAVARRLAERTPDLPVALAETGAVRALWFGIGVMSMLAGPGIGIAALASGVSTDRLPAMAFPVLLLGALGAVLMWSNQPWKTAPTVPVSVLPKLIEAMDGPA